MERYESGDATVAAMGPEPELMGETIAAAKRGRSAKFQILLTALFLVVFFCGDVAAAEKRRDASLTDAVRAADGEDVEIPKARKKREHWDEEEDEGLAESIVRQLLRPDNATALAAAETPRSNSADVSESGGAASTFGFEYYTVRYTTGPLDMGRFYSLNYESINANRRSAVGMRLVYGSYHVAVSGIAGEAMVEPTSLAIDWYAKIYATDNMLFVDPYLFASFGGGSMSWDYRQSIVDSGGYSFSGDSIDYTELRFGVGGDIVQFEAGSVSLYAAAISRLYVERTHEGFNNDLFGNRTDFVWGAGINLRF